MGTIDADPTKEAIIATRARPGGNVTGLTGIACLVIGLMALRVPSSVYCESGGIQPSFNNLFRRMEGAGVDACPRYAHRESNTSP